MYTLNENVTLYPRWKEGPKPFILYVAILDEAACTYFKGKTGGKYDGTGATDYWKSDWTGWENDIACANYEGIDPPEVLVFHVFRSRPISVSYTHLWSRSRRNIARSEIWGRLFTIS